MANQLKEAEELADELKKSKEENKLQKAKQMELIRKEQEGIEADRLEKEGPIVVAEKRKDARTKAWGWEGKSKNPKSPNQFISREFRGPGQKTGVWWP